MWWLVFVILAILMWGAVGYLQKISATLLSPSALLFWVTVGLVVGALALIAYRPGHRPALTTVVLLLGILSGLSNGIGTWCLFRALDRGAPAAIAIPLTALYPLMTVLLAVELLHESLSFRQSAGVLLAVAGGALLSYERPSRSRA